MRARMDFWVWLLKGSGGRPGYRRLIDFWLLLHALIGIVVATFVPVGLETAAKAVLLPLAGILVGLSFAWAGNAQALLQTSEIELLSKHHEGGLTEYVFAYQTAILAILVTLVLWGLAGLGCFDRAWPTASRLVAYLAVRWILFSFSSLALRECWHVVMSASWMLIVRREIKHRMSNSGTPAPADKDDSESTD